MKKIVISFISTFAGMIFGAGVVKKMLSEEIQQNQITSDKHLALFLMMNQWVRTKQREKNLASYFEANGYKRIAIYGMSYAGETLVNELKNTGIIVAYGIDRNAESIDTNVDIVTMDDQLEKVDAIVVTAITFFDEIEAKLSRKMDCPILSLEDILYEI